MRRPVVIEKRKWDGSVSARWSALFWREGRRLTWLTPAGTERAHPRSGRPETTRHTEVSATCGAGWIVTALLDADGDLIRYEVDATAAGEVERDGILAFIDLDLDLQIGQGTAAVSDLLEFAERREEMGYPPGTLSGAVLALDDALGRSRRAEWPFDGSLVQAARD
jgi:uncharacterized protein